MVLHRYGEIMEKRWQSVENSGRLAYMVEGYVL
jgi:hypothetical protein